MIILWVVAGALAAFIAAGYLTYRFIVVRRPPAPPPDPAKAPNEARRRYAAGLADGLAWLERWGWEDVWITGEKGGRLHGCLFLAKRPAARTVLAVHGYRVEGGRREFVYFAPMYLERLGMNLLLVDDYAHAQSEGKHIGFGWRDRLDCLRWAGWLAGRFGPECEILLHGVSMGAATVLMAAGEAALPPNVRWILADCGFTGAREEILHVGKAQFKALAAPLYPVASLFCKLLAGYFFGEANTLARVKTIKAPVLFIHGEADKFVPVEMVYRLYEACGAPKLLWVAPGAAHGESFLVDAPGYEIWLGKLLAM